MNKLWYMVEIVFYNGQRQQYKLESSDLVLLQLMVKNREIIRKTPNKCWFDREGILIDTRCIMLIKETEIKIFSRSINGR